MTRVAVCTVLLAASLSVAAQSGPAAFPATDGWHRWDVGAAPAFGACCGEWRQGSSVRGRCALDEGGWRADDTCASTGDRLRVYLKVSNGMPERLRAFSNDCVVTTDEPVTALGTLPVTTSLAWLARVIEPSQAPGRHLAEATIAAIALHGAERAYPPLVAIVEDTARDRPTRESALFWLTYGGSERTYDYLDRLLSLR